MGNGSCFQRIIRFYGSVEHHIPTGSPSAPYLTLTKKATVQKIMPVVAISE